MGQRRQRIRTELLIAFTLAVIAFGATRLFRIYRRERQRETYVKIEQHLQDYLQAALSEEQSRLEDFARGAHGRVRRDAAALLAQTRYLVHRARSGRLRGEPSAAREYEEIRRNFDRVRKGEPAVFPHGESFLRAFYSSIDLSLRRYSVCLPSADGLLERVPLILLLRPSGGTTRWDGTGTRCYEGVICAKPEGLQSSPLGCLQEDQVLGALDDLTEAHSIDSRRVYLLGRGGGGLLTWHVATHFPDRFAGVAIVGECSACIADRRSEGLRGQVGEDMKEVVEFLTSSFCPGSYAENLAGLSPVVVHPLGAGPESGGADNCVVERLRELGYPVEFLEMPVISDSQLPEWAEQYALAKMLGGGRRRTPDHFRFKTASLRHNEAYWVRLDQLGDPVRFSTVEAAVEGEHAEVNTQNVTALSVLPGRMPAGVSRLSVNGVAVALPPGRRPLKLSRARNWQPYRETATGKHRGLSGPFEDVLREPFLVVYGTRGEDKVLKQICRREAMRFADRWAQRHGSRPRLKSDSELTTGDVERLNLLLFGGPGVNSFCRGIVDALPVTFTDDGIAIGERRFQGEDPGILFCYPNPLASGRMIAMVAGATPAALYQAYDRFGLDLDPARPEGYKWFDYAVFDNRSAGIDSYLGVGFFDNRWRFTEAEERRSEGGALWTPQAGVAAELRPQGFPGLLSAADAEGDEVFLSDVRPTSIELHSDAVGFDRSADGRLVRLDGRTFPKALGVRVPSSLSFRLDRHFSVFSAQVGLTGVARSLQLHQQMPTEVVFEVWGDGELLASSKRFFLSDEGGREELVADVQGVRILRLQVRSRPDDGMVMAAGAWGGPTVRR